MTLGIAPKGVSETSGQSKWRASPLWSRMKQRDR